MALIMWPVLLKPLIGADKTVLLFQVVFLWSFCFGIFLNLAHRDDHFLLHVTLLSCLLSLTVSRLLLVRPCILMAIVFLFGIKGKRFLPGILISPACAFFYYLFFLYTIPLAAAHYLKGSRKFAYGLTLGSILSLGVWLIFTHTGIIAVLWHTLSALLFSRDGLVVSENVLSIDLMQRLPAYLIASLFLMTFYKTRAADIYAMLLLFTAPLALQARYFADISLPLMMLYVIRHNADVTSFFLANKRAFEGIALVSLLLILPGCKTSP